MSRPKTKDSILIAWRNKLIKIALQFGLNQSEVAFIFRLPRNTISVINKIKNDQLLQNPSETSK